MRTTRYTVEGFTPLSFEHYVWQRVRDRLPVEVHGRADDGESINLRMQLRESHHHDESTVLIFDPLNEVNKPSEGVSARIVIKDTVILTVSDVNTSPDEVEAVVTRIDRPRH